jgi:TrmH RNA methyltransferase
MRPRPNPKPDPRTPPPTRLTRPAPAELDREPAETLYGLRAVQAIFGRRRDDILRVAYGPKARRELEPLLAWARGRRVEARELPSDELERLAGASHHEDACVVARARRWVAPGELGELLVRDRGVAVALDRVRNPYNIGAILRSAAFFGVEAAILGAPAPHPGIAPDAVRVAEGGVESLRVARTTDLADTLGRLRERGVQIVGADGASTTGALGFPFARPTVLVMGNEREGLGPRIRACCDAIVAIPGTGAVESLNVAVAAGVLIAELVRARIARGG